MKKEKSSFIKKKIQKEHLDLQSNKEQQETEIVFLPNYKSQKKPINKNYQKRASQ